MSGARIELPLETRQSQGRASDPAGSAWVSANAGSGKTFVLTQRVVRLLLGGVAPSRILCLTFTKAAAATMSIRVFDTLAAWVTLDDAALRAAIVETGAPSPGADELARARRLFARTVETPGGLKILTIHAFCEKLLHNFPFEANVAARFTVIEDTRQAELMSRAKERVLAQAVAETDTPLGRAVEELGRLLPPGTFEELIEEASRHAATLAEHLRQEGGREALGRKLDLALGTGGLSLQAIEQSMLEDGLPRSEWDGIGKHLMAVSGKGSGVGEALVNAAAATDDTRLAAYLDVFLTQKLEPRKDTYLAKAIRQAEPTLCAAIDAERDRLAGLLPRQRAARAHAQTMALLTVAGAILDGYETLKRRRGLLDFSDLIERSRMLLARSDAAWVLYKLDAGIDHVLVDEAQDTSPGQWEILQAITRDFFAGEGQSRTARTFFAVGDEKQSIYSFQGARPAMFEATHQDYKKRAAGAGLPFQSVRLNLSFRSASTVLDIVDRVFAHGDNARGLVAGPDKAPPHIALKGKLPGLVEIWPAVGPTLAADPADWRLPVDVPDAAAPTVTVARRIADAIAGFIAPGSGETVFDGHSKLRRPVRAGDVLILVRSRNAFFDAVIRALKERDVPVAGADRVNLTEHIAVMDLMAAGRAALLPDDDLTLACVLKSPLVGLDDDDLLRFAPRRGDDSLRAALEGSNHPDDRAAAGRLAVWREWAVTLTPFGFYTRLLGQDGGRKAILGRLGPEAGDVVDEFMALTLAHERDGAPSLLAFLARLEGATLSIKRDMEAAGDAVRVMTVHAAKGLEAKIVFLPDTCGAPSGRHDPKLFTLGEVEDADLSLLVWSPKADADPPAVAATRIKGREAAMEEHRRLLYVALTRAEERLYVAGFHGESGPKPGSWYDMMMAADLGVETAPAPWNLGETVLRRSDIMEAAAVKLPAEPGRHPVELPGWITRPAPREAPVAPPIRPSNALGAADQPGRGDADGEDDPRPLGRREAAAAGRLIHSLLQHLPGIAPAHRRDAGHRFLGARGRGFTPGQREDMLDKAMGVLGEAILAPLFGPGSQAEVALAARVVLPDGRAIDLNGQVDRIAVTPDAVLIADYKSGAPREEAATPASYVTQLALYRLAVAPLYPNRPIRAFLVWTNGPGVTELTPETLDQAVGRLAEP